MTLALMRCCATAPLLEQYETATDALLGRLGIGVRELDFNCCGYPLRNSRFDAYVLSSARNLALAERAHTDLLTACSCCFGSLKQVDYLMKRDGALRDRANVALEKERLRCSGGTKVRHLLQVLHEDVGLARLREERRRTFDGLRVACHYGCHLLRPSQVLRFDDPASPSLLDALVESTGARSVAWSAKLDCCGSPASGVNDDLSADLAARKLRSARAAHADVLCVVCPYCHLQLRRAGETDGAGGGPPTILLQQLLGVSLGLDPASLGIGRGWPRTAARHGGAGHA